ncbi:MAG: tetratricopeptide repeat protein [Acidobacteriota bacterium]
MTFHNWKDFLKILLVLSTAIPVFSLTLLLSASLQEKDAITSDPGMTTDISSAGHLEMSAGLKSFDFENFENRINFFWFKRKAFLLANRMEDAEKQMDLLKSFCQQEGIQKIPLIARALNFEGSNYFKEGNFEKARNSFELAKYFDSSFPQARFELARTHWKNGSGMMKLLGEFIKGLFIHFENFWVRIIILAYFLLLIILSLSFFFAFFSISMLLKYNKLLRHEIYEHLTGRMTESTVIAAGWAVLLAPFLSILGGIFFIIYWPLIMFRYMKNKERIVCILLFFFLFFAIPGLKITRSLFDAATNEENRVIVDSISGNYDPQIIIGLSEQIKNHTGDPTFHFLIADHYKKGGYYREAYDHYMECLQINPDLFGAYNNIGNIFFLFEQYPEAIANYRKAIGKKPDFILAYYNMSLAQSELFHFKEAEESIARAKALDSAEVSSLMASRRSTNHGAEVIDAMIRVPGIWKRALGNGKILQDGFRDPEKGKNPAFLFLNMLSALSAASLFLFMILSFAEKPWVTSCVRCGKPFCQKCRIYSDSSTHCTQCLHLFVKMDGLEPEAKARKMMEIEIYENRKRKNLLISSIFFPGVAQNARGKLLVSYIITFFWLFGITWLLFLRYVITSLEPSANPVSMLSIAFAGLTIASSWLIGNWNILFRRE